MRFYKRILSRERERLNPRNALEQREKGRILLVEYGAVPLLSGILLTMGQCAHHDIFMWQDDELLIAQAEASAGFVR